MKKYLLVFIAVVLIVWLIFYRHSHAQQGGTTAGTWSPFSGTTGLIGGGALLLGNCASGTATVSGAQPGQVVKANTSDGTFLGGGFNVDADVTSANIVTVNVCASVAGTPAAKTYNVKVLP